MPKQRSQQWTTVKLSVDGEPQEFEFVSQGSHSGTGV
jgi:hypothetical protein